MVLIGFLGKKRSGKDTCADYLIKKYLFKKRSFATGLKKSFISIFDLNHRQLYGDLKEVVDKRWGVTPRKLMQFFGTDLMRDQLHKCIPDIGQDIWLKNISIWYNNNKSDQNIILVDCRFQNEVDLINSFGGIIIKIERNNNRKDDHISESGIDNITGFTHLIKNNNTIYDLYYKLDKLMKDIGIKEKKTYIDENKLIKCKINWILDNINNVECSEYIKESLVDNIDFIFNEIETSLSTNAKKENKEKLLNNY